MTRRRYAPVQWFGIDKAEKLHAKQVGEDWVLTFDFKKRLGSSETISGATWTCVVHAGTDADAANMISGAATTSGTKSSQKVIDGVDGVTYLVTCQLTTSTGQLLYARGLLYVSNQVRSDGAFR